jgi:hypothetical protein
MRITSYQRAHCFKACEHFLSKMVEIAVRGGSHTVGNAYTVHGLAPGALGYYSNIALKGSLTMQPNPVHSRIHQSPTEAQARLPLPAWSIRKTIPDFFG